MANILNPESFTASFRWVGNSRVVDAGSQYSGFLPVLPNTLYSATGTASNSIILQASFYDADKRYLSAANISAAQSTITTVAGCYYVIVSIVLVQDIALSSLTVGGAAVFVPFYSERVVRPVYQTLSLKYRKTDRYFRKELDGGMKFVASDYDYIAGLAFDTRFLLSYTDTENRLPAHTSEFYKTDCIFNADDRVVEVKHAPVDEYTKLLAGISKSFNLVDIAPSTEPITLRRRPIIQVYIPGDSIVTNIMGGNHWHQDIQIEPVFDHTALTDTYKFANPKNMRLIPASYAAGLTLNVTGSYDSNGVNGQYRLRTQTENNGFGVISYRHLIVPVNAFADQFGSFRSVAYYETQATEGAAAPVSSMLFSGTNGNTGSFYFADYRVYVRYLTDKTSIRGTATYPIPSTDLVANNANYRQVIGYNATEFYTYDELVEYPTKFGRAPDGIASTPRYYKEYNLPVSTGLNDPVPIASPAWRGVSLWFFNTLASRYTEFVDGADVVMPDAYPLHNVIQTLLERIGSQLYFDNTAACSEFLYDPPGVFGSLEYLDFGAGGLTTQTTTDLKHYITPKSNILIGNYTQAAQKADISLGVVLNMLRDTHRLFWHVDGNRLRIEHVSWYQNGGTYAGQLIGTDLTGLKQPRNGLSWEFGQNKYSYDKNEMPARYEFAWMDGVSPAFAGNPIEVIGGYVQLDRVESVSVGSFSSDIDFMVSNPGESTKEGFAVFSTVSDAGVNRVPFIEIETDYNRFVVLQNGAWSWLYLHPRYHTYDLPTSQVKINKNAVSLPDNVTRYKKQEIIYPAPIGIDPYGLVQTGLGVGEIEEAAVNFESFMLSATIKHSTE